MLIISHLFSAVISGRLSREKWRSSTSVCRSCCTARGSERHQAEVLKKFYRSLIETVRNTSPEATIMVSGPLPTYRQGQESVEHYLETVSIPRLVTPVERRLDACGETTLPVSFWISGQRLKHHTPMLTRGRDYLWLHSVEHRHNTMDHTVEDKPGPELEPLHRFSPLCKSERDDAVVIGTSMVRHVCATSGKDKVCTHCFPGAHVLDVAAQVPEILNGDERVGAVVLNVGANDIRLRF
ncbi:hypothetical protein F2P79_024282 [Pimephales promelas]|nr:hypothetical protein F2P79_024282 [Pimephales promelas]